MKPIELKIKGLSSFEEEQTIDFSNLMNEGIFGIFGPTGSGKSTIIDAIIIALYDRIPRYDEKGANGSFINVNSSMMTIEFTFSITNKTFTVKRAYKKSETGYKTVSAKLYSISGEEVEVVSEKSAQVSKSIETILGLTYNDFIRSVIIPQGKFSEFLMLENKARRAMLERIFALESYGKELVQKVKNKYNIVRMESESLRQKLDMHKDISEETLRERVIAYEAQDKNIANKKEILIQTKKIRDEYRQIHQIFLEYDDFSKKEYELLQKSEEMKNLEHDLNKALGARKVEVFIKREQELNIQIVNLKNRLSDVTQSYELDKAMLEDLTVAYEKVSNEKEHTYPKILKKEANLTQALKLMEQLSPLRKEHKNLQEAFISKKNIIEDLKKKLQESSQLLKENEDELEKLSQQIKMLLIGDNRELNDLQVLEQELREQIKTIENNNIVAIIAESLVSGEPCPVCGGTDHLNPAQKLADAMLESAREKLKQNLNTQKKLQQSQHEQKSELLKKEKLLQQSIRTKQSEKEAVTAQLKVLEVEQMQIKTSGMEKNEMLEKIKVQIRDLTIDAEDNLNTARAIKVALLEASEKVNHIIEEESKTRIKLNDCKIKQETRLTKKQEIEKQLEDILHLNKKNDASIQNIIAEENLETKEMLVKYLSYNTLKIQETLQDYIQNLRLVKENMNRLRPKLKDMENISDIENELLRIQKEVSELELQIEESTKDNAVLYNKIETMKHDIVEYKSLSEEYKHIEKKESILTDLDKLFSGNRFVEFVAKKQLYYITLETSKRLREMTSGRYLLELDGTDFIIQDNFNGGIKRSPKTLSGGEIFIVSFCLALALSSSIQLKSNTPTELFFLDEGFGTLDNTLIEIVMDSLEKLRVSNLTVGIITHVEDLKSRITKKIEIIPAQQGLNGAVVTQT